MIKNLICIISAVLILTACTVIKETTSAAAATKEEVTPKPAKTTEIKEKKPPKKIRLGDVVKTQTKKVTFKRVEYSYDVIADYVKPVDNVYIGVYRGLHHYPEKGYVFIHVKINAKNLGTQTLPCEEIITEATAYHDGDNKFLGMVAVEAPSTGFGTAYTLSIEQWENKDMSVLIEVPEAIKTSKKPLFIDFTIDDQEYRLNVR